MDKQIIVTISREYGSMGHLIAEKLADKLGVKFYDRDIFNHMSEKEGIDHSAFKAYDEKKRNILMSRTVNGFSNSIEEVLAEKIFDFERKIAEEGQSFVIVGRCADYVLRDNPNLVRVFVCGEYEKKINHLMRDEGLSRKEAEQTVSKMDKNRKTYHNYHCETKWGDSRSYDITVNSSKLGIDNTVELLYKYVKLYSGE